MSRTRCGRGEGRGTPGRDRLRTLVGTNTGTTKSPLDRCAGSSRSCRLHSAVGSEALHMANQRLHARQFGGGDAYAVGGEAVVPPSLVARFGVVPRGRLFDEAVAQQALDGPVERARAHLDGAVTDAFDVAHERVTVLLPFEEREHDVQ